MFPRVNRAQPGKDIEIVLTEMHAIVFKSHRALAIFVASENPVALGYPDYPLDGGQGGNLLRIDARGVANQVDFRQPLLHASNDVFPELHIRKRAQKFPGFLIFFGVFIGIRGENDQHIFSPLSCWCCSV